MQLVSRGVDQIEGESFQGDDVGEAFVEGCNHVSLVPIDQVEPDDLHGEADRRRSAARPSPLQSMQEPPVSRPPGSEEGEV